MRDLPMFTTQLGVASLVLKEIPYRREAYIRIQDSIDPVSFLEECRDFCVAAGAERVYATGHPCCESYPAHTTIWQMRGDVAGIGDTDAALFPVQGKTLSAWQQLYNRKMAQVPNASYMTDQDGERLLKRGDGYFVHRGETLLGIGTASGNTIGAVVSCCPGAGESVLQALCHGLSGEEAILEVASTNIKAVRLYERLGFIKTAELSKWYRIV